MAGRMFRVTIVIRGREHRGTAGLASIIPDLRNALSEMGAVLHQTYIAWPNLYADASITNEMWPQIADWHGVLDITPQHGELG